ncbi:MAG: DNA polymerase III subunit alpha [Betaproteobacteria bacterium]|nr:DNA polymerase III subunit alpha [Betaproteobacteria bacterium]
MNPGFAELHCLSNFTFLRGASHADELVRRAARLGYRALAVTDECSVAGIVRAHEAAKEHALHLIVGTELTLADGPKLVLLATDREGYGNLCALVTLGRRRARKGTYHLTRDDLADGVPGCLVLWLDAVPLAPEEDSAAHTPTTELARWLSGRFPGRLWLAAESHHDPRDAARITALRALSGELGIPVVAANDVHMHVRSRRALQDVLTAIRLGTPVSAAGLALHPNGERHLRTLEELAALYPPAWLEESVRIAERCTFSLDELRYEYPEELVPPGWQPAQWLRTLTESGLRWRFCGDVPPWENLQATDTALAFPTCPPTSPDEAPVPSAVRDAIEHELALIAELNYEPYFLTVFDIVCFARRHRILCQGRGSAANSAVCYALGITEVDPSRMSMLFERFISRERNEPPDIDVDFEHQRREEVIQYIYGKYTRERAALAATVICYRPKSAFRDVGKALGLDLEQVDRIARNIAFWDRGPTVEDRLRECGFDPQSRRMRQLLALARTLVGFPRHLSQHVGGFVVSRGPLSRLVPVENAAMPERSVIQWDKDDLDALGLLKVDVLALGMLSAIRRALEFVSLGRGRPFGMQDIPAEDPAVYDMLCRADTVGVFQIESRAQMSMLPRLRPRCFYDLVIEVAIVRPGPIQGGMVHPYLRRRRGEEAVTYPSEAVRTVLERTLGVPIFQEQVMQLAVVAAGFSAGEADRLRRSMAAWRRKGGLAHFEERLVRGMRERGYSEQFAQQIYQQILGFGEYGFPESHSASFALLVYVSAWLKHHEPAAFCAALLNSRPMGFYAPSQLVQDARRHGVAVRPADVLASQWECTLEPPDTPVAPPSVRLGLRMIKGLTEAAAHRLVAARQAPFDSFEQLALRARLSRHDLECLAHADALHAVAGHRREALWEVTGIEQRPPLLRDAAIRDDTPELPALTEGENIVADYASLGLTLGRHPLTLLRVHLKKRRMLTAEQLRHARHGSFVRAAGLVTCRQRPGTASGVIFVTLEDETGSANIVVWRDVGERQRRVLLGAKLLAVHGVLEREGDVAHLVAARLEDLSMLLGNLTTQSRDFH